MAQLPKFPPDPKYAQTMDKTARYPPPTSPFFPIFLATPHTYQPKARIQTRNIAPVFHILPTNPTPFCVFYRKEYRSAIRCRRISG